MKERLEGAFWCTCERCEVCHRIRGLLSCVLKSFFGYFHPGVGFKAVSITMPFKNVDIFQFFGKAIASHGKAGRATDLL